MPRIRARCSKSIPMEMIQLKAFVCLHPSILCFLHFHFDTGVNTKTPDVRDCIIDGHIIIKSIMERLELLPAIGTVPRKKLLLQER